MRHRISNPLTATMTSTPTARIVLHIGITETGAPDIQRWLAVNQAALLEQGVLYAATGRTGSNHDGLIGIVTPEADGNAEKPEVNISRLLSTRDRLRDEITASKAAHVIFSSERLCTLQDLAPLQDLLRHLPVQVVIYLRRHDFWWEASYRAAIRQYCTAGNEPPPSFDPGFLPFLERNLADREGLPYFNIFVDRWAAAFGKENLIIRTQTDRQPAAAVVADFVAAAGIPVAATGMQSVPDQPPAHLPRRRIYFIDLFARARVAPPLRAQLLQHALNMPVPDDPAAFHVPARRRQDFLKRNGHSYEYIAREFLGRPDGDLFQAPEPSPAEGWAPEPAPDALAFVEEAVKALSAAPAPPAEEPRTPGFWERLLQIPPAS